MTTSRLLVGLSLALQVPACALAPAEVTDDTCTLRDPPPEATEAKVGHQFSVRQFPPNKQIPDSFTGCVTHWYWSNALFQRLMYRDGKIVKRIHFRETSGEGEVCAYDWYGNEIRTGKRPNEFCPVAALFSLDRVKLNKLDTDLPVEKGLPRVAFPVAKTPPVKRIPIDHDSCRLDRPPPTSVPFRITADSQLIQFPDPRTLPSNFTGCLTRWFPSGEEWGQSRYIDGKIVQLIVGNSACNYKDGGRLAPRETEGPQAICPPASVQSIERIRAVEEKRLR